MALLRGKIRLALVIAAAFSISGLLIFGARVARETMALRNDIRELEVKESNLIRDNEKENNEISLLKSSARIKDKAENELNMHVAESEEIVRVQMKDARK